MSPNYGETYCITTVCIDNLLSLTSQELADVLQEAYSGEGLPGVAGMFEVKRLGRATVFTFERTISEDFEVLADKGWDESPQSVINQLVAEVIDVSNSNEGANEKLDAVLSAVLAGLRSHEVEVAGLPCQYPKTTLQVVLRFTNSWARSLATEQRLADAVDAMAESLGAEVVTVVAS